MIKPKITKEEMLSALDRSGYLLESEISKYLAQLGFFVESNQVIKDPITGKSREIDIVAEYYDHDDTLSKNQISAKVYHVLEIKNNLFPIVLLTESEFSPNIDKGESLKEIVTKPGNFEYESYLGFYKEVFNENVLFNQYCSFHKKKENDELMALHPDNIYDGLLKIVQYCEEETEKWSHILGIYSEETNEFLSEYFRHFIYIPILLINDDLFELKIDETGKRKISKVDCSKLLFNYYYNGNPKMCMIFFVTKKGFPDLLRSLKKAQDNVSLLMLQSKSKGA